jgi:hypothetical protein
MRVDEAGRSDLARGVDLELALLPDAADGGDAPLGDRDVRLEARRARAVDDGRIADEQRVFQQPAFCIDSKICWRCVAA